MTKWQERAFDMGWNSRINKENIEDNPFDIETETFEHDSWQEGWIARYNSEKKS